MMCFYWGLKYNPMHNDFEEYDWTCGADLKDVDRVCAQAAVMMEKYNLSQQDGFALELLLREALNNAMVHGNGLVPGKQTTCKFTISSREAVIQISDQGEGFPWRSALNRSVNLQSESGRGLVIYNSYATEVHFNESGNTVTLRRIFQQGEENA